MVRFVIADLHGLLMVAVDHQQDAIGQSQRRKLQSAFLGAVHSGR